MYPGVRIVGEPLFASIDLERAEWALFYAMADDRLDNISCAADPPNAFQLHAGFAEHGCAEFNMELGSPGPIGFAPARQGPHVIARMHIPFSGCADWFYYSARTWPEMRPAHGRVVRSSRMASPDTLMLAVEVDQGFEPWAAIALQAELDRIRDNLDLLAMLPDRIAADMDLRARYLARHMIRVWQTRSHRAHRPFMPPPAAPW